MRLLLSLSLVIPTFTSLLFNFQAAAQQQQRGLGLAAPAAGRFHALVIGNNAYRNLRRLQTAENDAREVEALLRTRYGFRTKLLLNATRQ
ncbi:MAG: caspase family protein, partial [Acidobacteria bacterium]|nr:caspase family protein [Acidobacteriota bacterium]